MVALLLPDLPALCAWCHAHRRQHKLVCQPEKLRPHVPAEREALLGIKRAAGRSWLKV